jgi:hypothetical protein
LDKQHAVIGLCYSIGNDAFVACQYETASKWLEKAVVQLDARTADQSQEKYFKDLDLCVRYTLGGPSNKFFQIEDEINPSQ